MSEYNCVVNRSLCGCAPEAKGGAYAEDLLSAFLARIFAQNDAPVVLRQPGPQETICRMLREGRREVLVWDEMTKISEMHFIENCMPLQRPVVDFCCGYGYWISKLLQHIDLGVDLFPDDGSMYARTIWGIEDKGFIDNTYLCVLQGDCTNRLPIPDASCATVMCISGMEHIADYRAVLAQTGRILRPGGSFILTVGTDRKIDLYNKILPPEYMQEMLAHKNAVNFLGLDQWKEALCDCGFEVSKIVGYLDPFRMLMHALTTYPHCYKTFWDQKAFADIIRNDADLLEAFSAEFLPWLTRPCPPERAGLLGFKCVWRG